MAEHSNTCAAPLIGGDEVVVALTREELEFVLNELHSAGHGHGSSKDDFEPECPSCTAADKLRAARSDGVTPSDGGKR